MEGLDYVKLIVNISALFVGLLAYIIIFHTKLGKKLDKYQYAVLLVCLILAVIVGGALRVTVHGILP